MYSKPHTASLVQFNGEIEELEPGGLSSWQENDRCVRDEKQKSGKINFVPPLARR